jgi:hypothetical protein
MSVRALLSLLRRAVQVYDNHDLNCCRPGNLAWGAGKPLLSALLVPVAASAGAALAIITNVL